MTSQHEVQSQHGTRPGAWPEQYELTSARLNRLAGALNAASYLEIGVHTGVTFQNVRAARKTAVDPAFMFDVAQHTGDGVTFAEMTSDDFFAGLAPAECYDVIYIDGLHTFEQTYRDLCIAILHSHARSVLLLDDTLPSDVYSSLRDPEECWGFRAAAGVDSSAWHGDVFKVVFAVHDFHLGLDYRTIVGSGNPQTLVWRSSARRGRPVLGSLEEISRMTYFDMVNLAHVLRECDEERAITECLTAIGEP
jgi:hypothetical protein